MAGTGMTWISARTLDRWQGRRVLVTGYTGFIGSWLTTALLRLGGEVSGFALDDAHTRARAGWLAELGARGTHGDIRDLDAIGRAMASHRFDVVFHLAAQPLVSVGLTDPQPTLSTNIGGSINVLEAARRHTPAVLVHVTSDKCYRNRSWPWPYRELDELGAGCPYSTSKAAAELVFAGYARLFHAAGDRPRAASVRFGNVVGGGDHAVHRLVPDTLRALRAGESVSLRRPAAVRPWQHVLDVVNGLLLLADALAAGTVPQGDVFNFAPPGDGATARHLAEAVCLAWSRAAGQTDPQITEGAANFVEEEVLRLDGRKAANVLGWQHRFDLTGMAEAIVDWHLAVLGGTPPGEATVWQVGDFFFPAAAGPHPRDQQIGAGR